MFDIHQTPTDENGEWEDGAVEDYCNGLMAEFAVSPEGCAAAEHFGDIGWARSFLYYGFNYLGSAPPKMSSADVEEILFDLFPQKVSTEPERAGEIIGEIRAFFEFLHRQYGLTKAADIMRDLGNDATSRLERELADPANFGMAKSFLMLGNEAGFDMNTQEGLSEFMRVYNASIAESHVDIEAAGSTGSLPSLHPRSSPEPNRVRLTASERKSREKLRRKKLGKSKRR
jgi:hypothetical protein